MEENKVLNNEELENKERKLKDEELNDVSGGDIRLRPSDGLFPGHSAGDGNLI